MELNSNWYILKLICEQGEAGGRHRGGGEAVKGRHFSGWLWNLGGGIMQFYVLQNIPVPSSQCPVPSSPRPQPSFPSIPLLFHDNVFRVYERLGCVQLQVHTRPCLSLSGSLHSWNFLAFSLFNRLTFLLSAVTAGKEGWALSRFFGGRRLALLDGIVALWAALWARWLIWD